MIGYLPTNARLIIVSGGKLYFAFFFCFSLSIKVEKMFDTKAILLGLICYGYCFYHIAEKIRYYQEINEDVHNEQENFKLRWTNEMMNKLIDFKDNQISRIITERSRHSWAKGKMVQFYDDFKVRPVELEAANLFIGNR